MSTEESPAQWVFIPTLVTGNPEIDAAGAVVTAFEKLLIAGKGDAAFVSILLVYIADSLLEWSLVLTLTNRPDMRHQT